MQRKMCEEVESSICIVPMIGLPASGKTFFSSKLKSYLEKKNVSCLSVCYDELVPLAVQKELRLEPGRWKREREMILGAVDLILSGGEGEEEGENNKYFNQLKTPLLAGRGMVILIDDNNYLQSMRYEYYQLARKHRTGFAQLYFSCDSETAVRRNSERPEEERVPSQVILTMAEKLEPPNPLANKWECFSFSLAGSEEASSSPSHNLDLVETVIQTACRSPVRGEVEGEGASEEERQQDRLVCSASIVHQADKHLRALVNKKMISMKHSGFSKEDMNLRSKSIYSIKTEVLEDLKTGWTKLDKSLIASVEKREPDSGSKLEKEMEELFDNKLKIESR